MLFGPLRAIHRPLALNPVQLPSLTRHMAIVAPPSPPRGDAAGDAPGANESAAGSGNGGKPWDDGLITRILHIRRTARVTRAGKVRSLYALVVVGNGNGGAGYGEGKSTDLGGAVQKAMKRAKRDMIVVNRYDNRTIFGTVVHKFIGSEITLRPAPPGSSLAVTVSLFSPLGSSILISSRLRYFREPNNPRDLSMCWHPGHFGQGRGKHEPNERGQGHLWVVFVRCQKRQFHLIALVTFLQSKLCHSSRNRKQSRESGVENWLTFSKVSTEVTSRNESFISFHRSSIQRTAYPSDRVVCKRAYADSEQRVQVCDLGMWCLCEGSFQLCQEPRLKPD